MSAPAEAIVDSSNLTLPRDWRKLAVRILIWGLIAVILAFSAREGLRLRRWTFDVTDPIRFVDDISRGCYWGLCASGPEGYLNQYDKMQDELPDRLDSKWVPWLDYAPLRLLVMREWGQWQRRFFPPNAHARLIDAWQRSYDFNKPILIFNSVMAGFSALCAFFLTRHWVIRGNGGMPKNHFDGIWQGLVAALIIWFSPDVLLNAHAWIGWDSWVVPFFLCTVLLASLDWWFAAGLVMAVGTMFKAQQLMVAPIFIIWPLMQLRFGAALRWVTGLVFGIAVIASGWMLTYLPASSQLQTAREMQKFTDVANYPSDLFNFSRNFDAAAATWIGEIVFIAAAAPWLLRITVQAALQAGISRPREDKAIDLGKSKEEPSPDPAETNGGQGEGERAATLWRKVLQSRWIWAAAVVIVVIVTIYWPFLLARNRRYGYIGILGGAALAAASIGLRPRHRPYVVAGAAGCALLLCMLLFHGGTGWAKCTFAYGLDHWPYMTQGPASNMPAVFEVRFGWPHEAQVTAFTLSAIQRHWPAFIARRGWWPAFDVDISAKTLFDSIYVFFLILSGIAVGLQARRNDRRMLVALATPWLMFFLWPVQVHERYLLFATGAAACCIGNSVGTCLLGIFLVVCSTIMHVDVLMRARTSAQVDAFGQNLATAFPKLFSPDVGQTISQYVSATHPDMAWALLVASLVFLYLSLTPSAKRGRSV